MDPRHHTISENVLFGLLMAAMVGWVAAPVAADLHLASTAGACFAAASEVGRS